MGKKVVSMSVDSEFYGRMTDRAASLGISVSALVKMAVKGFLDREGIRDRLKDPDTPERAA